ncbi:aminotransferase class V-fold PLP-dependent enzyme [Acetobacter peroxydans]|jgi:cysteine desulfurase/selenocysteine lyase|uniref:aminotransferase class V-fold PLP-dependent enzyme n=1 Tax=Acetobacter peroxydans TaxID=104098 RepID=UPI0023561BC0|nr:cysteine desulfurase [Acetobacter peroxydans]MCH4142555.1 cysteine desulfurase [Acetobacter peroxydans]MCI1394732.1 cysteine desulfurase [Acetobacter peroxydans]MCI1410766.1 cysteine desulfurase [Acetobacter peroxydans]MCI1440556.1 cysteine desulfurase [Acetobacter peroxydans]MCI1566038.1 cysteine desulfurase [Acetobacter peroxydans]
MNTDRTLKAAPAGKLDVQAVRAQFPILSETVHGRPFVFLDSGASAQKPAVVIDCMADTMRHQYANIHRGLYWMSERTSEAYEAVRGQVAAFLNAPSHEEIIFTRNSTEAINLVAHSLGSLMKPGQAVLISEMEHHANLIPWQMLRDRSGVELRVAPITDEGDLDMEAYGRLLEDGKVALVAMTHMSNVLGTVTPAREIADRAHEAGALVLFDGSQAAVHRRTDVQALGADFYTFTGHKLYGPTGIGVLWGRRALLDDMPPFLGGGDMISSVTFEKSTWANVPHKFEAGTPAIVETIGLGAAIRWVESIGFDAIEAHEQALTAYALEKLADVPGLKVVGAPKQRGGVISFTMADVHPHDIATLLDRNGIAVRAGQHCAEPLMRRLGLHATTRASFGVYTDTHDIDVLAETLVRIRDFFV